MTLNQEFNTNYTIEILNTSQSANAVHRAQRNPPTVAASGRAMLKEIPGPKKPPYRKPSGVDVTDELLIGHVAPEATGILPLLTHGKQCRLVPDAATGQTAFQAVFVVRTVGDLALYEKVTGNSRPVMFVATKQGVRT